MNRTSRPALAVAVTAALSAPAGAQIDATGIWHGVLQSPVGPLTLVLTVTADDDGTLAGLSRALDTLQVNRGRVNRHDTRALRARSGECHRRVLGLKLQSTRAPLDALVIDHIEPLQPEQSRPAARGIHPNYFFVCR